MSRITMDVTYQIVTPESASQGDYADQGYEEEGLTFDTVDDLISELMQHWLEPSSTKHHEGVWYTQTVPERDLYSGEEKTLSFHPKGLNKEESETVFNTVMRRRLYETI